MNDDRLDRLLREHGDDYNRPAHTPLDRIWHAVEAHLVAPPQRRATVRRSWLPLMSGAAAAVLVGFLAGRLSSADGSVESVVAGIEKYDSTYAAQAPFRQAATRYLGQAAVLLLALESTADGHVDTSLTRRAGDLLVTTRLLLDSPDAQDANLRSLISDLELVLAQINRLEPRRLAAELDLISEALRERDLLPRIQTAVTRAVAN